MRRDSRDKKAQREGLSVSPTDERVGDTEEEKSFLLLMKTRISRAKGKEGVRTAAGCVQKTHLLFGLSQSDPVCLSVCLATHRRNKRGLQTRHHTL